VYENEIIYEGQKPGTVMTSFPVEPTLHKWFYDEERYWIGSEENDLAEDIIYKYEQPITDRIAEHEKALKYSEYYCQ
jgi:hypothetical protein